MLFRQLRNISREMPNNSLFIISTHLKSGLPEPSGLFFCRKQYKTQALTLISMKNQIKDITQRPPLPHFYDVRNTFLNVSSVATRIPASLKRRTATPSPGTRVRVNVPSYISSTPQEGDLALKMACVTPFQVLFSVPPEHPFQKKQWCLYR